MVEDGGHVFQNDVYAEIEVMKMVMELRVAEGKSIHSEALLFSYSLTDSLCKDCLSLSTC